MENKKDYKLNLKITTELANDLKELAKSNEYEISLATQVRHILQEYVNNHKN